MMKTINDYIKEGRNEYIEYVQNFFNENKKAFGLAKGDSIEVDGSGKLYVLHENHTTTSLKAFGDSRAAKNYFCGVIDAIKAMKNHDINSFGWCSL